MSSLLPPRASGLCAALACGALLACGAPAIDEERPRPVVFDDAAGGDGDTSEGSGEGEGEARERTQTVCLDITFDGALVGVSLLNALSIDAAAAPGPGTALVSTGSDPFLGIDLAGPGAGFSLAECGNVEVTFSVDAGAQGQIFWWRQGDPWYAEERGRFFPLVADGASHTVVLDLSTHPLWTGMLRGLRLDPTDTVAHIRLERLRVVGPAVAGEGAGEGDTGDGAGEGNGDGDVGDPGPCPPGFVDDAEVHRCVPLGPPALVRRTEAEVCARWAQDDVWTDEWSPTPGSTDPCDVGVVPQEALDNGLRRVNLYRWLVGVEPARLAPELFAQQQACATLMAANGTLTHHPSPDMACYSSAAAAGAGSSNIAGGGGIAGSVDMYMQDFGGHNTHALGHRRWTIGPFMNVTQFGVKGGYSCMYTFGVGGGADPGFVAWPPPGFVPAASSVGGGDFSFESDVFAPTQDTVVAIAVDEGDFGIVEHRFLQGNYGHYGTAIAFAPPGGFSAVWQAGRTVRVRITATRGGDVEYTIRFSGC